MAMTQDAWARAWREAGGTPDPGTCDDLLRRYAEPHRRYHTTHHLAECLEHFEAARASAVRPGEVALALWFHDAIYDPHRQDNERLSAEWAQRAAVSGGLDAAAADRIHALVMATRHDAVPEDADARLLVDVDLAILGAPPRRFDEYEQQVREEYAWVPGFLFRRTRRSILESFLARPHIYSTPHFRERLEDAARANLSRSIELLA